MQNEQTFINKHLKHIELLTALYKGKKFFVECMPTDIDAKKFPNSNFAIKEIAPDVLELHANLEMRKKIDSVSSLNSELVEALEALCEAMPKQTEDADWWNDNLTDAYNNALKLINKAS